MSNYGKEIAGIPAGVALDKYIFLLISLKIFNYGLQERLHNWL